MIIAPEPLKVTQELPRFSLRSMLVIVAIASLPLAVVGYLYRAETLRRAEIARLDDLDQKTMVAIVQKVDAICLKLGRTPKNQAELENLLGKPIPEVHERGQAVKLEYHRTSEKNYQLVHLSFTTWGDYLVYDSSKPNAGWVPFAN